MRWQWLWLVVLLAAAPADDASAGAWARGKGKVFVAGAQRIFGLGQPGPQSASVTLYTEYGLTDVLTLGADMGGAISGFDKAVVFISRALPPFHGVHSGLDFGTGTIAGHPVLRPGLSLGYGLSAPSGWVTGEFVIEHFLDTGEQDWKADFTVGLNRPMGNKLYLQLQTGRSSPDPDFGRLAVSLTLPVNDSLSLDMGASKALWKTDKYRLKLGFWKSF